MTAPGRELAGRQVIGLRGLKNRRGEVLSNFYTSDGTVYYVVQWGPNNTTTVNSDNVKLLHPLELLAEESAQ